MPSSLEGSRFRDVPEDVPVCVYIRDTHVETLRSHSVQVNAEVDAQSSLLHGCPRVKRLWFDVRGEAVVGRLGKRLGPDVLLFGR